MIFITGVFVGIILALLLFILETILETKQQKNLTKYVKSKVEDKFKKQPKFFDPPSDVQETQQQIIDRNEKLGKGTKAEELGL